MSSRSEYARLRIAQEDDANLRRMRALEASATVPTVVLVNTRPREFGSVTGLDTHDGENLAQAVDRFGDDIEDPLDKHTKSRGRIGWQDIPHAIINIPVSWARERGPKITGKVGFYGGLAAVVIILALLAFIFTR